MLLRAICAGVALVSLPGAAGPVVYPIPDDARIVQVFCRTSPTNYATGTAFRVGPDMLLSVDHVTSNSNCAIAGEPIKVLWTSEKADFSVLSSAKPDAGYLLIDCNGFKAERRYLAIGYARSRPFLTAVELTGTAKHESWKNLAILKGVSTVIPGQSGGPVLDAETGKAVGTVNTYDSPSGLSGSRELKDTEVCSHAS